MSILIPLLLAACLSLPWASAYSFIFDDSPQQCGTVKLSITGSGTPPYRLSIVPFGGSPLSGLEVRKIMDMQFNDSSSLSFTLPYPTNSQFVAVVSDNNATGSSFGSGGTTVPVNVLQGSTNSCLPTTQVSPPFTFSQDPLASLTTCQAGLLTWNSSTTEGTVNFWGVIPGGDSFIIPREQQTTDQGKAAISWTPDILPGVNVLVVVGDDRRFGSGGSFQGSMQPGNGTTSCIQSDSPVSTPGSPAGGSYPTNASGGTTGGGGNGTNVGAIVGGVIGGVAAIAIFGIVVFFLLRRRRSHHSVQERPVDLLEGREHGNGDQAVPEQYIPEPYHIPDSTTPEMSELSTTAPGALSVRDRRHSGLSVTTQTRLSSDGSTSMPPRSSATAKSAAGPTALRAVNIIQHEDAGPSEPKEGQDEGDTVELPPAYTNLRR